MKKASATMDPALVRALEAGWSPRYQSEKSVVFVLRDTGWEVQPHGALTTRDRYGNETATHEGAFLVHTVTGLQVELGLPTNVPRVSVKGADEEEADRKTIAPSFEDRLSFYLSEANRRLGIIREAFLDPPGGEQ